MKNKIGIICDSTSYLPEEYRNENDIYIVDLNVIVDSESFVDNKEISNEEMFQMIDQGKKVGTSQPSPESFLNAMNIMSEKYEEIICFTMSSKLSGTFNSANIAKDMYEGSANIEVIDTKTSAMGIKACVDKVLSLKESSVGVVASKMNKFVSTSKTYLTIDDLQTLVNHGRMKASQAMVGNLLRIKPLLMLDEDGSIEVHKKIRTHKKLISYLSDLVVDSGTSKVYITYVGTKEYAVDLFNDIKKKASNVEIDLCNEIGPVLAVSLGRGGIGIYITE